MNQIFRFFYTLRGPYSGFRAKICPAPQLLTILGKELNNHISINFINHFWIPFFQIGSSFQVIPVDSCKSGLTWESRDSSVGRALDWRSKGPRFDPGSRQFCQIIFWILYFHSRLSSGLQIFYILWNLLRNVCECVKMLIKLYPLISLSEILAQIERSSRGRVVKATD